MGAEVGVTLRAEGGQIVDELYTTGNLVVTFDQIVQMAHCCAKSHRNGISISVNITDCTTLKENNCCIY